MRRCGRSERRGSRVESSRVESAKTQILERREDRHSALFLLPNHFSLTLTRVHGTMTSTPPPQPPRQGPLYAFAVPPLLIADFTPRQLHIPESHPLHPSNKLALASTSAATPLPPPPPTPATLAIGGAFTCALTGASFPDLPSLRQHYKTDWYKYNVKLKLQGKPTPVSEEQFAALIEGASRS